MNIPGIGHLFQRENKQKTMSRLYLFVRPKILSAPDFGDLTCESERKKDDVNKIAKKSAIKPQINEMIGRGDDLKAEIVAPEK